MDTCIPRTKAQEEIRQSFCKKCDQLDSSRAHGIVGETLELEEERIPERHFTLRHQDAGHIGLRTNPPMRTGHTAPLEFPGGVRRIERRRREGDGAPESKALARNCTEGGE